MSTPIGPPSEQKSEDKKKAIEESKQPTVSHPGGFKNDPDDPTNPNEAIERHRRKLKPQSHRRTLKP